LQWLKVVFGDRAIFDDISGKRTIFDDIFTERVISSEWGLGLRGPTGFEKSMGSAKRCRELHGLPKTLEECIGSPYIGKLASVLGTRFIRPL